MLYEFVLWIWEICSDLTIWSNTTVTKNAKSSRNKLLNSCFRLRTFKIVELFSRSCSERDCRLNTCDRWNGVETEWFTLCLNIILLKVITIFVTSFSGKFFRLIAIRSNYRWLVYKIFVTTAWNFYYTINTQRDYRVILWEKNRIPPSLGMRNLPDMDFWIHNSST